MYALTRFSNSVRLRGRRLPPMAVSLSTVSRSVAVQPIVVTFVSFHGGRASTEIAMFIGFTEFTAKVGRCEFEYC